MSEKRGAKAAPLATQPEQIRNVVLVGPTGSGKTSLMESLLFAAGATTRMGKVEDGSTIGDVDPVAIKQRRSVGLSVASIAWQGLVINLIDTPGYADFVADLRAGLRAADAALFVIGAVDGVDAATQQLWDECESVGLPRAIVVTKLDKDRADFEETVAVCRRVFTGGGGVLPLHLPIHANNGTPIGFIDLLTTQIHEWTTGKRAERECDPEHEDLIEQARGELIEGIITESEDENLMDSFVAGHSIDVETLTKDFEGAVARGHFHPVLGHSLTPATLGTGLVLDLIVRGFPSPTEHPLPVATSVSGEPLQPLSADPAGPICAEVIKTTTDPYIGKLSIVRVFSGTLAADQAVHVSGHFESSSSHQDHDVDERIGVLTAPLGAEQRPVERAIAGSIVSVSKLTRAETGDTLSSPAQPLIMESWLIPEPLLPIAIRAHSTADEDKLGPALARVLAEDPTLRIDQNDATGQMVVWCLGEAHADLVAEHLKVRYGVNVDTEEVRISLRETFAAPARGTGRHIKQSGGHGQYAICEISVEPLPVGTGFEFVDKVVGGAVPRAFIGSVEKGVRAQLLKGVAIGYPVVDIRVTLVDGKSHSVDSSDMAFQTAGALALKDAASKAAINLLEPLMEVLVLMPDEHVGAVMSDLSTRRGHVTGTESIAGGRSAVRAIVPEAELTRYAIDIRSLTHGTGNYTRKSAGFAPMPSAGAKKILGG
ncbi:MAG: elongation factor G-like protein EF-G2 [Candidatus Nanopelagicales bacterium]|nr:elongation factor G-like protein EF-G2 [Candidatus Nanopelagicales bacterium]